MPNYIKDGVGFHHHKIILITGRIQSISELHPKSKLKKIKLEEFDDDHMYFFDKTLKNLPAPSDWSSQPVTLGIIDFFLSKNLQDLAFIEESARGSLVFEVPNATTPAEKMVVKNFTVEEKDPDRFGGTRACSPSTFLDDRGKMINYKLGNEYYFPVVTFADRENPMGNCYFSFCKGPEKLLNNFSEKVDQNYIIGINDNPKVDLMAQVLVHEKIIF